MALTWAVAAIISALFWALGSSADKVVRDRYIHSSFAVTALLGVLMLATSVVLMLFFGLAQMTGATAVVSLLGGVFTGAAIVPYFRALSMEEASRVIPLLHFSPLFTLFLAIIFLGEVLSAAHYAAFALMLAGGVLIGTRRIEGVFHLSPAVGIVLLSSLLFAVSDTLMKHAYVSAPFWPVFSLFLLGSALAALSLFAKQSVRVSLKSSRAALVPIALLLLFSLVFGLAGQGLFGLALVTGPVTLVSSFIAFQSLFMILIGVAVTRWYPRLFTEVVDRNAVLTKLFAVALMFSALLLL